MVNEKLVKNIETQVAFEFGRLAFHKGIIRAPCQDENIMKMYEGKKVGEGIPLSKAWLNGWDVANLAASF